MRGAKQQIKRAESLLRESGVEITGFPVDWQFWDATRKLQYLYGVSLDVALSDLLYTGENNARITARTSARHDVMMIA